MPQPPQDPDPPTIPSSGESVPTAGQETTATVEADENLDSDKDVQVRTIYITGTTVQESGASPSLTYTHCSGIGTTWGGSGAQARGK